MIVKIKKLSNKAVIPAYAKKGDAGMDLTATKVIKEDVWSIVFGTDISIEIPEGYVGLVFPRSSIRNTDLIMANSVGVVDSGYRGEIQVSFFKLYRENSFYNIGDRVAQLIIIPYPHIEFEESHELSETERGINGHGSTNK